MYVEELLCGPLIVVLALLKFTRETCETRETASPRSGTVACPVIVSMTAQIYLHLDDASCMLASSLRIVYFSRLSLQQQHVDQRI
jgi:hypothetical protein